MRVALRWWRGGADHEGGCGPAYGVERGVDLASVTRPSAEVASSRIRIAGSSAARAIDTAAVAAGHMAAALAALVSNFCSLRSMIRRLRALAAARNSSSVRPACVAQILRDGALKSSASWNTSPMLRGARPRHAGMTHAVDPDDAGLRVERAMQQREWRWTCQRRSPPREGLARQSAVKVTSSTAGRCRVGERDVRTPTP